MIAFSVTAALFLFALLVGLAVSVSFRRRDLSVVDVLLAPATGFALIIVIAVPLNRWGLPVGTFALPLAIVAMITSAVVCALFRTAVIRALWQCRAFGAVVVIALVLTANPMISYGLDWFSYSNEDAINYSISAERLRMQGQYVPPHASTYINDRDVRETYYFLNGSLSERIGVDELLAFHAALFNIDAFRAIMPTLVALHLAGIGALGALVYRGRDKFSNALVATSLLAVSPLATFGVEYQLLGQVCGLVFVTASLARCCLAAPEIASSSVSGGQWAFAALSLVALCEVYPELAPFAVLTIIGFYILTRPKFSKAGLLFFSSAALAAAILLNSYTRITLHVILSRLPVGGKNVGETLFPYYLLPSGIPNVMGLLPIATYPDEPWLSLAIAVAIAATGVTIACAVRAIINREPAGILAIIYGASALLLFVRASGFGLYKIAMYVQPIIAAVLATAIVASLRQLKGTARAFVIVPAAALICVCFISQKSYVYSSRSEKTAKSANFVEIPSVSENHLLSQWSALRLGLRERDVVLSDTFNSAVAKIESYYTRGNSGVSFPESDELNVASLIEATGVPFADTTRLPVAHKLQTARRNRFTTHEFFYGAGVAHFAIDSQEKTGTRVLWLHGARESPFNRMTLPNNEVNVYSDARRNILAFIDSSAGRPYFVQKGLVSLFQLEPDVYYKNVSMSAVGRYLLFEVINPTRKFRVRLSLTESMRGDRQNVIPPASIIGRGRVFFPLSGRGSADVVSGLIEPTWIGGHAYIMIDLGKDAEHFLSKRTGFMNLWGRDVEIDPRLITAFLRDVSIIETEQEPKTQRISSFPRDLAQRSVEYSGIYEDGWASDDISVRWMVGDAGIVRLRGTVPSIGNRAFSTVVSVYVDEFLTEVKRLGTGDCTLDVMAGSGPHRIRWKFSRAQNLPGADGRPATMLIQAIE